MLKSVAERLKDIQKLSKTCNTLTDTEIQEIPSNYFPTYTELLGQYVEEGTVIQHNNQRYRIMQYTLIQEAYIPGEAGLYAIFRLYRDKGIYPWVEGEYVELGDIRTEEVDGEVVEYEAYTEPGVNIHTPSSVPSVWQVKEVIENAEL